MKHLLPLFCHIALLAVITSSAPGQSATNASPVKAGPVSSPVASGQPVPVLSSRAKSGQTPPHPAEAVVSSSNSAAGRPAAASQEAWQKAVAKAIRQSTSSPVTLVETSSFVSSQPATKATQVASGQKAPQLAGQVSSSEPAVAVKLATEASGKNLVQLNFPESFEVKMLIDFVSKRQGLNILYDDSLVHRKVTVISPSKIPQDSLMDLLQCVLKTTGLALVDADQPGWKRIIANQELLAVTKGMTGDRQVLTGTTATTVITQVFALKRTSTARAEQVIQPFLSKPGGNVFSLADRGLLFVTDYADKIRRMDKMIELLEVAGPETTLKFVSVKHWDADELAKKVTALMAEEDRVAGRENQKRLTLTTEPRENQIVVVSTGDVATEALRLIALLDVPDSAETRSYQFRHVAPQRIDALAKSFAGANERYKSSIDGESGTLIVTATANVHQHIETLKHDLDVAPTEAQSSMRFYKLLNTTAAQVLGTIRSLEGLSKGGLTSGLVGGSGAPASVITPPSPNSLLPVPQFTGPNQPPAAPGQPANAPPFYRETPQGLQSGGPTGNQFAPAVNGGGFGSGEGAATVTTKDATITSDPNTNTLIIVAPPAVQATYARLISMLDKRRPQVLIAVTMVTLDTSHNFSLGVQLTKASKADQGRYLTFSSFGLGTVDPSTGSVTLTPGSGFNGILLDPSTVSVVMQALASDGHSKVMSAPKILTNDNATGNLSSVAEAPFTSTNASQTVATTAFAGYASAGTTVTVTPHIAEGDHLLLNYSFTLNSFEGRSSASGVPPPRQTNTISSEVTVPDGYTVVIGGLTRKDLSNTVSKVPFLGDVPLLGLLFSSQTKTSDESTLFVFLQPIILRDDQFSDLKYLSDIDNAKAGGKEQFPTSKPLVMQ